MDTGEKIKAIRAAHRMTQTDFATSLGISRSALTQLEAGNTKPNYEVLQRLVSTFEVDVHEFFKEEPLRLNYPLQNDDAENGRRVRKIIEFYDSVYGNRYNVLLFERLLRRVNAVYPDKEKGKMLVSAYRAYTLMVAFCDKVERVLIDPLKRYSHQVKLREEQKGNPENEEDIWAEDLQVLQGIVAETEAFMERVGNVFLEYYEESRGVLYVEEEFHATALQKVMHQSTENTLNIFESLLKNADLLNEIEKFYNTDIGLPLGK